MVLLSPQLLFYIQLLHENLKNVIFTNMEIVKWNSDFLIKYLEQL
jgi:hypothetical protein